MDEILTLKQLRTALSEAGMQGEKYTTNYAAIARALMNNFAISRQGHLFRIVELEFYHNATDDANNKKKTYERKTAAGDWYFHSSGVDISFESTDSLYGGILIRAIHDEKAQQFIKGPQNVVNRLFDRFTALDTPEDFPVLIEHRFEPIVPVSCPRYNYEPKDSEKKDFRFTWPAAKWDRELFERPYPAYPFTEKGELKKM